MEKTHVHKSSPKPTDTVEKIHIEMPSAVNDPEFIRSQQAERLFGLKRGTLYNLARLGKIRGFVLRIRGNKTGVRLWCVASIRELIQSSETSI